MATDRQAVAALEEIDQILRSRIARRHDTNAADGGSDYSAEYQQIRVQLDTALTLIDRIPVYGRKIATAVRFLMQIGDRACIPGSEFSRSVPDATASRKQTDALEVSDVLHLIQDGRFPWAHTRRREPGVERPAPSSAGMIGVI